MATQEPADDLGQGGPTPSEAPKRTGGLVLTRHLMESIVVGDDVTLRVVGIRATTTRIKVVAPRSVPVHRREVFDTIRAEPAGTTPTAAAHPIPGADRPTKPGGGLVLTRHEGESIMIGPDVEVIVVEVRPTTVRLKVVAPRSVPVHRLEVFEAIRDGHGRPGGPAD